jgi:hypothetical protein
MNQQLIDDGKILISGLQTVEDKTLTFSQFLDETISYQTTQSTD